MQKHVVVISTEHALTRKTFDDFQYCEVLDTEGGMYVRTTGKNNSISKPVRIIFLAALLSLASRGRIFDKGLWMIEFTPGYRMRMNATPLYTES